MIVLPKKWTVMASAAVSTMLLASAVSAVRQPDPTELSDSSFRDPGLTIDSAFVPADQLSGLTATQAAADLASLRVALSDARLDQRTQRWATLLLAEPMLPANAATRSASELESTAWQAVRSWLVRNAAALRIDPAEIVARGYVTASANGDVIQVHVPRVVDGIPVRGNYLTVGLNHGNLVLFGAHDWGTVGEVPAAVQSAADAIARMEAHLGALANAGRAHKPELELIPLAAGEGIEYRLAWAVRNLFEDPYSEWEALVDAVTGDLIAFEDKTNYASTRKVIGGVYPRSNDGVPPDGVEQVYPLPFADFQVGGDTLFGDTGGNLPACVDGTITSNLSGPYLTMIDTCGAIALSTAGNTLDFGTSGGIDCTTPGFGGPGNTHASRSGFYEINRAIEMGRSHLPSNPWLRKPLPSTMNINSTCNATGGAGGLRFYRSGGGCSNTGEIAGVFDHEWGHGMDASDATPGISVPGEGIADIYAALRLDTSCIGRNFRLASNCGGYGDPCTACSGVRDIDYAKRASGNPHTIDWVNANCSGTNVHCRGAVYAEAVWDLWKRDLPAAPFNMSDDTAHELTTRLTFVGAGGVGTWFANAAPFGGCAATSGYMQYLLADDDNGNLSDGTPHMTAIYAAFNRHQAACATPTVQNSGCAGAPTTAPTIASSIALDRGVFLEWNPVAGATTYRIFRTEGEYGCAFGKTWIGETSSTAYLDTSGLANGRLYSYVVFAMGNGDSCFGPASACTQVTPAAGPNVAYRPGSAVTIFTGDGDPFVDNCEAARVSFSVDNIGTGTLSNVRIASVTSPSHPALDASISYPSAFAASLAACATAGGGFTFQPSGLAHDDQVEFLVQVTSDELESQVPGQTRDLTLSIAFTESDLQAQASKTYTFEAGTDGWNVASGTFNRSGAGGGNGTTFSMRSSTALDNQCDKARSPVVQLSPTSTLSLYNNYDIEPQSGGTWYDRANVAIEALSGTRTVVAPSSGRLYNASNGGPGSYSGCNDGEPGWAATQATWGTSSWSAAAFGAIAPAGLSQVEVTYSTDGALANAGFWFDEVTLTNFSEQVSDAQGNTCPGTSPFIFADDFESAGTSFWSATF